MHFAETLSHSTFAIQPDKMYFIFSFLLALLILVFLLIILWYLYLLKCMWPLRHIPGPTPLPIIGCSYLFPNVNSMLAGFTKMTESYGPICKMMIGVEPSLLITDYETLEAIFKSSKLIEKSKSYRHFHNWLGFGLLTSGGTKWRARRKLLTPSYHFSILDGFLPVFDSVSSILVHKLNGEVGKPSVDIYPYITLCALDIICQTAMGVSVNALLNEDSEYVRAVKGMCGVIMEKVFSPLQHQELTFKYTKNYQREKQLLKILNDFIMNVVQKRRDELAIDQAEDFTDDTKSRRTAFLDLLLQTRIDGKLLSDEDLREEVHTFMFEGHDTTASALSFALYSIANHENVQEKIIQEQYNIFQSDKNRMATLKDLSEMKYLELVIKETLRLYPSVPFYARETQEEIQIGHIKVPKNFTLIIYAMGIQRDSKYFEDPLIFKPERFLYINGEKSNPYSFIPFSAGHRNCIGQKFAVLEMKATLSKIVRNFVLFPSVPNDENYLISETILKSLNGIKIRLEKRI